MDWEVDSAGTGGWHTGELPDSRSIKIAGKYGIDLTYQRARKISIDDLSYFDLILAMDKENIKDILRLPGPDDFKAKVKLITYYSEMYKDQEVPDPYYDNRFQLVFNMLQDAVEGIIQHYN